MARQRRPRERIWSAWGDWIWSRTHRLYYQQRQDNNGVIETRWGPTYDEEDAHGDEGAIDDGNADDDDTKADDGDDDDNADDGDNDDNVDDDEDADDLAEQLENTHFEGEDDSNDRRKGKAREQYDLDGNNDSGAEDSASVNHDLVYDDPQPQEETVSENFEESADHSPFGTQIGAAPSPTSRTRRARSGQYYQDTDHSPYYRGRGSSSSAVEQSEGTRTGMTADRSDYISGDTVIQHSIELDPRYRVEHSHRFQPGEVFKVLWPEPSGQTSKKTPTVISDIREVSDMHGGRIYVGFRRFIVIANDSGHCSCVPIATYGGKACKKKGIKPEKHGIISEKGTRARTLEGEPRLGYPPVRMEITVEGERLARESRINYSKIVTVEHNVLVFFIGSIYGSDYDLVREAVNDCWEKKSFAKPKRRH